MAWVQTIAKTDYTSGPLNWIGGGDPDIYSQPGRTTRVTLVAENIRPSDGWRSILIDVRYEVLEMAKNNTLLSWRGTAELPIPIDAQKFRVQLLDIRGFNKSWYVKGKIHDNIAIPDPAGTIIAAGSTYRIDGAGNDQTNAQISLYLQVPLMYDDAS
jgi:hypothetical protein